MSYVDRGVGTIEVQSLCQKYIEESPDFKFSFSVYSISFHCKNNENESEQLCWGVLIYTQIFGYSVEVGGPTYDVECMILGFGIHIWCWYPMSFRTNSLWAITDVGLIALSLDFQQFHSRWH
jgi:hypothetical protein